MRIQDLKEMVQVRTITKPTRNITKELVDSFEVPSDDARAQQVAELIKKCLQPDPKKRLMPEEALRHTFFKDLS